MPTPRRLTVLAAVALALGVAVVIATLTRFGAVIAGARSRAT